ncbi:MAG: hypothetical protein IJD43_12470 [Thermoguttaceae bacterium]|nr:hypothetical protein [Planctomycetaceae bacterium]MBQ4144275.1 hypothetical protein [Thermoguttaceae bacterium]
MKRILSRLIHPIIQPAYAAFFVSIFVFFSSVYAHAAETPTADGFYAGAVSLDITPERPVTLSGQFYTRISKGANTPITANILALNSVKEGRSTPAILISMDVVSIREPFNVEFRKRLQEEFPEVPSENIILCATHTHAGPNIGNDPGDLPENADIMHASEYTQFVLAKLIPAIRKAWESQVPSRYGYGLGFVNIAYNRRAVYADGSAVMYGKTDRPNFRSIEGMTDNDLNALCIWDKNDKLTAMLLNIACPSQENEHLYYLDADFWGRARNRIRAKYGEEVVVLGMCGAAGDQSPHIRYRSAAEERMTRLRELSRVEELGRRIAVAVDDIYGLIASDKKEDPVMKFEYLALDLPQRLITEKEYQTALSESKRLEAEYEKTGSSSAFGQMNWHRRTIKRYEFAKENPGPTYPTSACVLRLGDIVLCTNQFELYTDFGIQMKARSKAVQTFVIQLASGRPACGTYLPTEFAVKGGGYGAVPASNMVGPEGGLMLVEETLKAIERVFAE